MCTEAEGQIYKYSVWNISIYKMDSFKCTVIVVHLQYAIIAQISFPHGFSEGTPR